jgi:hypothetical protein
MDKLHEPVCTHSKALDRSKQGYQHIKCQSISRCWRYFVCGFDYGFVCGFAWQYALARTNKERTSMAAAALSAEGYEMSNAVTPFFRFSDRYSHWSTFALRIMLAIGNSRAQIFTVFCRSAGNDDARRQ